MKPQVDLYAVETRRLLEQPVLFTYKLRFVSINPQTKI